MEKLKNEKVSYTLRLFKYHVDPQIPFIMPPLVAPSSAERDLPVISSININATQARLSS